MARKYLPLSGMDRGISSCLACFFLGMVHSFAVSLETEAGPPLLSGSGPVLRLRKGVD